MRPGLAATGGSTVMIEHAIRSIPIDGRGGVNRNIKIKRSRNPLEREKMIERIQEDHKRTGSFNGPC